MIYTDSEVSRAAQRLLLSLTRRQVPLPKPVADAVAEHDAATTRLADLEQRAATMPDDLTRYATTGTLPEDVATLALSLALAGHDTGDRIRRELSGIVRAVMVENVDALVEAMRPEFDAAVAELDAAAETLGAVDLDDLTAVTALGGDAAEQWKRAHTAEGIVRKVQADMALLVAMRAYPSGDKREALCRVVDFPDFGAYRASRSDARPWELRRIGTLALATPAVYEERVEALDLAWSQHPDNRTTRVPVGVGQFPSRVAL